ncbi:MAG TPA: nicotinate-nucleotide adenylyltransferase [Pyrinomonadaceae bacterium]|nr:nicotinate-nucleotide adenylyltransferase [Pyrinomonadaceae bacterium]
MRKRIAIYGGTFDPVHTGHLEIARQVSELFAIDQFLFVPARKAPHKHDREVTAPLHRHAMLVLATQADSRHCVSILELEGPERQYTVDTIAHFGRHFGEDAELFFVMGADSWLEISSWRESQRLMTMANLIVVTRPGFEFSVEPGAEGSPTVIDVRGLKSAGEVPELEPAKPAIFVTDAVMIDVSATEIREAVRDNRDEDLNRLVPLEVANYIRKYQLYRNTNEA